MSRPGDFMRVVVRDKGNGHHWIEVHFIRDWQVVCRWAPSFHDLWEIWQGIAECEDERYPPPSQHGRGMTAACARDLVLVRDFAVIASRYRIPWDEES